MQKVKLFTGSGGFVVAGWVPPFLAGMEAEVLLWGERVFSLSKDAEGEPIRDTADGSLLYNEAFAVALVNVETSL